jgi:putative addiction module component (TIGR02574 family)
MSFAEVLQELPTLTFEQRQVIIRNALELDNAPLNAADEALVESRLAALREDPQSGLSLEEMKVRVRSHYRK